MSYQVLALKWRPQTFEQMVGQQHALRALTHALDNNRLHHAYLFTGTRGVGKTSLARLLAKCLNCETGITSTPCGQCESCVSIEQGRALDLIEVDAASRTRVEDTRELLDNVQYAPTSSRFKIYLIDEVHMLSTHSFNALLKTLEEPPEHVKFLLATTDPQKLPITILSRCLQFHLKNLSAGQISAQLAHICQEESITFEQDALNALAHAAQGSMRDSLSLLDQAIAFCESSLTLEGVSDLLGDCRHDDVFALLAALLAKDSDAVRQTLAALNAHNPDHARALTQLTELIMQLALAKQWPETLKTDNPRDVKLQSLLGSVDANTLQILYQSALLCQRDLPLAPSPESGFEMAILRLLCFVPESLAASSASTAKKKILNPTDDVVTKTVASQFSSTPKVEPQLAAADLPPSPITASSAKAAEPSEPPPFPEAKTTKTVESLREAPESSPSQTQAATAKKAPPPTCPPAAPCDFDWKAFLANSGLQGLTDVVAKNCVLESFEPDHLVLSIQNKHAGLATDGQKDLINQAVNIYLDKQVKLTVNSTGKELYTPANQADDEHAQRLKNAAERIQEDPKLKALQEHFDGEIRMESLIIDET